MERMRIIIAEKDIPFRKSLREILTKAGYLVIGEAEDGISALKMTRSMQPEAVLAAAGLPALNGLELAGIIEESRAAAVILLVDYSDRDIIYKPGERGSTPVLVKPFDEIQLFSMLEYAYAAFNKVTSLESEVNRLRNDLNTRKLVEKAKGILMKTQKLTEEAAFRRIQQQSMRKRTSMKNIAEAIITAHEISNKPMGSA